MTDINVALAALRAQSAELEAQLSNAHSHSAELQVRYAEINRELEDLSNHIPELATQIDAVNAEIKTLEDAQMVLERFAPAEAEPIDAGPAAANEPVQEVVAESSAVADAATEPPAETVAAVEAPATLEAAPSSDSGEVEAAPI